MLRLRGGSLFARVLLALCVGVVVFVGGSGVGVSVGVEGKGQLVRRLYQWGYSLRF